MPITFTKVNLNGIAAIQIDGDGGTIYVKILRVSRQQALTEDGNHHIVKAYAQEVDINGIDVSGSVGPITTTLLMGDSLADGTKTIQGQLRGLRRAAIKNFLSSKKINMTTIPDNLSDVTGEVEEPVEESTV